MMHNGETRPTFSQSFVVSHPVGLHLRPAAMLVRIASRFTSSIEVSKEGKTADARSVMGILELEAIAGTTVTVTAMGDDAVQAISDITRLFALQFDHELAGYAAAFPDN